MVLEGGDEIKGLLYARHCSRCGRYTWERQTPCYRGAYILVGEIININM